MIKTDFDACLCPSFPFGSLFDALNTFLGTFPCIDLLRKRWEFYFGYRKRNVGMIYWEEIV